MSAAACQAPEPLQYEVPDSFRLNHLSRVRMKAVRADAWKHGTKYAPLPVRCEFGRVDEMLTAQEDRLLKRIRDRADPKNSILVEGCSVVETASADPKARPRSYQFVVSGGLRGLGQLFRFNHMTLARTLDKLEQKCVVRKLSVGDKRGQGSVYVFDHYEDVKAAVKRGGRGDSVDTRIGVDAGERVWHNGRVDSKRLLTEAALADYHIDELFPTPAVRAERAVHPNVPTASGEVAVGATPRPAADAIPQVARAAGAVEVPACINLAIDTWAPATDGPLRLRIFKAARGVAEQMKASVLDEEIAVAIGVIGMRMRNRTDILNPGTVIEAGVVNELRGKLEARAKHEEQRRKDAAVQFRRDVKGALRDIARLASKQTRDEGEGQLLSVSYEALTHLRKQDAAAVADCEREFRAELKCVDARPAPATWRPEDPEYTEDHPRARPPDQCPECGKYGTYIDGFCRNVLCRLAQGDT